MSKETIRYDDAIVRRFVTATIVWGAVGMLVGLWCAGAEAECATCSVSGDDEKKAGCSPGVSTALG